jgi:hypothetical protein
VFLNRIPVKKEDKFPKSTVLAVIIVLLLIAVLMGMAGAASFVQIYNSSGNNLAGKTINLTTTTTTTTTTTPAPARAA